MTAGEDESIFRTLADSIPQLAWIAGPDGDILWLNRRWFQYTGTRPREMEGRGWRSVVDPDDMERVFEHYTACVMAGREWEDTFALRRADGQFRRFLSRALPVRDQSRRVVRWFGTNTDVEDSLRVEEALRVSEERYRLATRAAGEAIWDWDLVSDTIEWSEGVRELFGYPPHQVPDAAAWWMEHIHSEDRQEVLRGIHAVVDGSGDAWQADYRFLRADGAHAEVTDRGFVLRGAGGRALRMIGSMRDVTAERRHEQEVRAAHRAAEEANRAKSQFLATMSHEIRTPINAILGYNDLLEVGIAGPLTPPQLGYVEKVKHSGQHLLALVNDILDLSKVEAGEMTVRRERLGVLALLDSALELMAPLARLKGVELVAEGGSNSVYLGDEDRARQVLVNLLSNAVKFTDAGGTVALRTRVVSDTPADAQMVGLGPWVTVEVQDTGIGIPPEQLGRVFEPFVQVDGGHTRRAGGTGLGLAISRRFARLMGGDLTLRSSPGDGSCFVLWLPTAGAEAPTDVGGIEGSAWPSSPGEVPGLSVLGHLFCEIADPLARDLADRLRRDPEIPSAEGLDRAQLEDHMSTFIMEVGKALIVLDEGGGEPALMHDGESIQRTIAKLHGEQRRRLGWSARELRREFELQKEMAGEAVAREAPARTDADTATALAIVHRLLDRAEQIALAAHGEPQGE